VNETENTVETLSTRYSSLYYVRLFSRKSANINLVSQFRWQSASFDIHF